MAKFLWFQLRQIQRYFLRRIHSPFVCQNLSLTLGWGSRWVWRGESTAFVVCLVPILNALRIVTVVPRVTSSRMFSLGEPLPGTAFSFYLFRTLWLPKPMKIIMHNRNITCSYLETCEPQVHMEVTGMYFQYLCLIEPTLQPPGRPSYLRF